MLPTPTLPAGQGQRGAPTREIAGMEPNGAAYLDGPWATLQRTLLLIHETLKVLRDEQNRLDARLDWLDAEIREMRGLAKR